VAEKVAAVEYPPVMDYVRLNILATRGRSVERQREQENISSKILDKEL
jgi:hypothetical protein